MQIRKSVFTVRGITLKPKKMHRRGESKKQKLLEMIQVTVQIIFYFDEI